MLKRKPIDWSLYLVTDPHLTLGRPMIEIVMEAVKGGVSVVQLREKESSTRDFVELARALKKALTPYHVPLIINDRLDVMLASGADGLHIGQSDLSYQDARNLLGPDALLGLSVENEQQVQAAKEWQLSYLALSPLFSTPTKTDTAAPWGLEGLKKIRPEVHCPLVVIGGIHLQNAKEVLAAGADSLAIVSAIMSAPNVAQRAQEFRQIIGEKK